MNKKILVLVASFFVIAFILIFYEQENVSLKDKKPNITEPVRAINKDVPMEQQNFTASDEKDDSVVLKEMFQEVTDYMPSNNELQAYITGQSEFRDNRLFINAEKQKDKYISGKLESRSSFRYGTFQFKVKTVNGKGLFPAIWLIPAEGEEFPEVDIYELIGSEPNLCYGVLHYYKNDMKKRNFFQHKFPEDEIPEEYEVTLKWSKDKLTWYIDGDEVHSITENVPQVAMYLNINLAVGGIWPGNPDESTEFPSTFEVGIEKIAMDEVYER